MVPNMPFGEANIIADQLHLSDFIDGPVKSWS